VPWAFHLAYYRTLTHQSMSKLLVGCNASVAAENIGMSAAHVRSLTWDTVLDFTAA
jgi:hypothetical protein